MRRISQARVLHESELPRLLEQTSRLQARKGKPTRKGKEPAVDTERQNSPTLTLQPVQESLQELSQALQSVPDAVPAPCLLWPPHGTAVAAGFGQAGPSSVPFPPMSPMFCPSSTGSNSSSSATTVNNSNDASSATRSDSGSGTPTSPTAFSPSVTGAAASTSTASTSADSPRASSSGNSTTGGSLNSTRVVLGRAFTNGQLTYTVPLNLNVQLDTGSGDLWLANEACNSDSCKGHQGLSVQRFDDTADSDTPFDITYLLGSASGSVKTASMLFGDLDTSRLIAFGSCNVVANEDMDTGNFSGLGPPANSLIQADLNATSNIASLNIGVNPPETGAVLAGFWNAARPGRRFMGIGLQRLEEEGGHGDSVMTIGNHDPAYAGSDPSQIAYTSVIGDADGVARHWRVSMTDITVQLQHGVTEAIPVGTSSVVTGGYPIAVFDSGASINLGPESTLNALYGAWGIGPASDGGYYVPCDLQMNITLGLGGIRIPIHPLDASLYSSSGVGTSTDNSACIGSFQALRSLSGSSTGSNLNSSFLPADFVLSPAFMRSAYTVFSCDGGRNVSTAADAGLTVGSPCQASVGLRPLVNMTLATQQFNQVRVKKESLGQSGLTHGRGSGASSKGMSGGIKVVIGCVCAIVVIAVLFGVALWRLRRRRRRIAAARAALLAAQTEKPDGPQGHSKKQSNPFSMVKIDGLTVPMDILGKEDDESSQVVLSPAQRAKARQLHQIHGVFDDELQDEEVGRGIGPEWGEEARPDPSHLKAAGLLSWDVSSTGYKDARQVKNAYLASLSDEERRAFLGANKGKRTEHPVGSYHDESRHELHDDDVELSQTPRRLQSESDHSSSGRLQSQRDSGRASSPAPLLMDRRD
ncbi:LOW QUALITY PROTEIN: acid protease [Testicularia cyperi]|uniref:Acid protease n=1 Tax=Testicularia cyperi TaxID=1882483 RepID=A0A317XUL0_9BASI|nr:LOW QUALITY PROTEIN: acid protease [Testicularia cyperi]